MLAECLRQVHDGSCNKTKSLTFFISSVKISHDRGITSFVQQVEFCCVNSPVYFVIISAITGNPELHHK